MDPQLLVPTPLRPLLHPPPPKQTAAYTPQKFTMDASILLHVGFFATNLHKTKIRRLAPPPNLHEIWTQNKEAHDALSATHGGAKNPSWASDNLTDNLVTPTFKPPTGALHQTGSYNPPGVYRGWGGGTGLRFF